ncbi:MAG: hypothetical protein KF857_06820 [Fimbriimonadaceae bacterium]|nr:hypothetical protein [Fimbriimonadaceae bacterium]
MLSGTKVAFAVVGLSLLAVAAQASQAAVQAPAPGQVLPLVAALGFAAFRRRGT